MKIYDFNIEKGIYDFEFDDLNSVEHAHPVVEIVCAISGTFSLMVNGQHSDDLFFAVIDSNVKHLITSEACVAKILMLESNNQLLTNFLRTLDITLKEGSYHKKNIDK